MEKILKAYGKVNLFLSVGDIRADGKHEVITVMRKVGIYDTVTVSFKEKGGVTLSSECELIPLNGDNIVFAAVKAYEKAAGIKVSCHLDIKKNIPVTAGMGGGSSDAAAVLLALNERYGALSQAEMCEISASLGSDVPFFLYPDKTMLGTGTGHLMTSIEVSEPLFYGVFVIFGHKDSTAQLYKKLDGVKQSRELLSPQGLLDALRRGSETEICGEIFNDFEKCSDHFEQVKNALVALGCKKAFLCGSGPTVCGLFTDEESANNACRKIGFSAFVCKV